ncbi:MAG TPA: SLBB domain-containing protein [Candidatus Hydrothermia bacterium]|nr:SLBB domain-containing protein [Candidatus Hydrothermae bacterium]HOK22648.1 SLBB domain-containing protein [Candidatus Hydrothermia bacterium]HOL23357.1 SLBB domain-containing protein [Candidatus Hydrothermia bacterium]HPO78460.1 SLBB domain-containing protein [Candidatus Hydrothermia bacterium]HRD22762.1 SLBB domain-containing protein [Candidatus Hydrothermia bacterium]
MLFSSIIALILSSLVPGDAIVIRSTNYRELNDTLFVIADTTAELPYIGRINVSEITEESLRSFFIDTYSKYLKEPDLAVFVLYRISILGRVNKPGIYYVPPFAGLGDILAMSGGPLPDASLGSIKVYSNGKYRKVNFEKSVKESLNIKDLKISSGTVIEVPKKYTINLDDIYKFAATAGILWSIYSDVLID